MRHRDTWLFTALMLSLLSACHSSMPARPQAAKPAPQSSASSSATPAASMPDNKANTATVSGQPKINDQPKVIHIPTPQAESSGNATDGIDTDVVLETTVTPKVEPIVKGTTKPYIFNGETITPMASLQPYQQTGLASWYGKKFHGRKTASGEIYNMYKLTAAHRTLPIPSYLRVTNLLNQKSVVVRVNDRGPFSSKRILDLSYAAAKQLDMLNEGSAQIEISLIDPSASGSGNSPETSKASSTSSESVNATNSASSVTPTTMLTPGFYLQAGAFSKVDNATRMQQRILDKLPELESILNKVYNGNVHQVLLGPYSDRALAAQAAAQLQSALALRPIIISR